MASNSYEFDFHVIYNRALSSRSHTNDTRLSTDFTEYLVAKLEADGKTKGYLEDRDAVPGRNKFTVLREMVKHIKKTIVVVTPEFIRNCWQTYSHQTSFKRMIDEEQTEKLIPIALCITEMNILEELNIAEWIYFDDDYTGDSERVKRNWCKIQKALADDTHWNSAQLVTQDHGDNKLRTENDTLVTQPTASEFFSDALIQEIAEQFPTDWTILCIQFGLKDHEVDRIRVDHPNDSRRQAFKGLKSCLNNQGNNLQKKFDGLVQVLRSMRRMDVIHSLEKRHQDYEEEQNNVSVQNSQSDHSHGGFVQVVEPDNQIQPEESDQDYEEEQNNVSVQNSQSDHSQGGFVQVVEPDNQIQPEESDQDIPDSSNETSFISRELEPTQTAVINTRSADQSYLPYSRTEPLSMDPGPSLSLPLAPVVKVPSAQSMKPSTSVLSNDGLSLTEMASGDSANVTSPSIGNDGRMLDPSHKGCGDSIPRNETAPSTGNEIKALKDNTELKELHGKQTSLSNDDDVTIDAVRSVSFQPVVDLLTNVSPVDSSELNQVQMLNLKSFDEDPVSTDSGVSSIANTPLNDLSFANQTGSCHNSAHAKHSDAPCTVEEQIFASKSQVVTHTVSTGLTENQNGKQKIFHSSPNEGTQSSTFGSQASGANIESRSPSNVSNKRDSASFIPNCITFLCRLIQKPEYAYN